MCDGIRNANGYIGCVQMIRTITISWTEHVSFLRSLVIEQARKLVCGRRAAMFFNLPNHLHHISPRHQAPRVASQTPQFLLKSSPILVYFQTQHVVISGCRFQHVQTVPLVWWDGNNWLPNSIFYTRKLKQSNNIIQKYVKWFNQLVLNCISIGAIEEKCWNKGYIVCKIYDVFDVMYTSNDFHYWK